MDKQSHDFSENAQDFGFEVRGVINPEIQTRKREAAKIQRTIANLQPQIEQLKQSTHIVVFTLLRKEKSKSKEKYHQWNFGNHQFSGKIPEEETIPASLSFCPEGGDKELSCEFPCGYSERRLE